MIGQLARFDDIKKEELPGNVIFSTIDSAVKKAQHFFGGSVDDLVPYYVNRGFIRLNKIDELNQMVHMIT